MHHALVPEDVVVLKPCTANFVFTCFGSIFSQLLVGASSCSLHTYSFTASLCCTLFINSGNEDLQLGDNCIQNFHLGRYT